MATSTTATYPAWEQSQELEVEKRQHELSTPPSDYSEKESTQTPEQQLTDDARTEEEQQWATGIKLLIIMAAITLVCFLMLLDTSIIVTVRATAL
jgi:flagellar biosynthesis protein FliP